ncbi:hypothetical protein RhiirA5_366038, partial [Rhizophagus irregularis]
MDIIIIQEKDRRWQHREETMATNREHQEIMAKKLAEWDDDIEADRGQEEYHKDSTHG